MVDSLANIGSYKVYMENGGFPNGNLPSSQYLLASLSPNTMSSQTVVGSTGNYYFRVYSSNDAQGILSPGYATGVVNVSVADNITNVIISSLEMNSYSGIYAGSASNKNITLINSNDVNPTFNWQVGFLGNNLNPGSLMYRATIRNVSMVTGSIIQSRIPNSTILGADINNPV